MTIEIVRSGYFFNRLIDELTNCGTSTGRQQDICIHPLSFAYIVGPVCDSLSTLEKPEEPAEKPSLFMLRETHRSAAVSYSPQTCTAYALDASYVHCVFLSVSWCFGGCWLAGVCEGLPVCGFVCVCFLKKKKIIEDWWAENSCVVWGKKTNYMSTKRGEALCLATYQPTPTSTHTRTQTNPLEEKGPARRSGGKHVVSILEGRTHPALRFLHLPTPSVPSLFLSAGCKHKGK